MREISCRGRRGGSSEFRRGKKDPQVRVYWDGVRSFEF